MKQILQKMKQYTLLVLLVLMSNYGWGQTYSQVTTIGGLVDGNYLIVGDGSADGLMLNTITTGTNPYINYNTISNPGTNISTGYNASNVFQINVLSGVVTIFNSSVGYVSWGRTGVTGNAANFFNGTIANTERWTATVASGLWTLRNESDSNRILQWNPGSPRFACYTTNQTKLKLYRINNTAPTATSVSFSGTTTVGQTLTGSYTYNDTNEDAEGTSTFQWYRADNASGLNSEAISGATATTYTLQAADNGKYIRFGVVPVAASGTSPGVEAFSSWQGSVTDPTAVTATLTPSVALTEQNLNGEILTLTLENTTFTDATLDAANFTLNNAPSGVSISGVSYTNATAAQITLAYNDTDFDTSIADFSITTAASELSAAQNLTSSSVSITAVTETLSVSAITSFGSPCLNSETTQTFTVSGANLKVGNVSLAALSGFTYSLDNTNFTPTLTIASAGGTLAATTIHVKFVPTAVQSYNGNIVVSGVGAPSVNRSVVGSGINTTPTITTPISTSITTSTAILGGNITVVGCTPVTTRGIEYSTISGFSNGSGTIVSESDTFSTGTFTVNISGLTSGTTYYYRAFATSASGTSYTVQGTFSTLKIEPANHPTNFAASGVNTTAIVPQWTASVAGSQAPDGYLIKASTTTVADPVDGTDPANSTIISSGSANRKVTSGTATSGASFTGMSSGTMYNYKIYPYTNTGTSIDFKITDAPSFSHATLPTPPTSPTVSNLQANTVSLSWTLGTHNAGNKVLVFVKQGSAITTGTPTTAPVIYSANTFFGSGTAYQNDSAAFCVYKGDSNTVAISGLLANTTYHVVIYRAVEATNSNGTNSYSAVLTTSFSTLANPVTLPYAQNFETTTSEWVLDASGTNKWAIGAATNNGGTKALYISSDSGTTNNYSTTTAQTGTNASVRVDLTGVTAATLSFDWKSNGENSSGTIYDYGEVYINTGSSDVLISGAKEFNNTTTFATKSIDLSAYVGGIVTLKFRWVNDNSSGNQPPFAVDNVSIVPIGFPNFTTTAITNITYNSADTGGTITTDGGSAITARGVVYATTPSPTLTNSVVPSGSGNGSYTSNLTGLLSNTTYYVRAYVTNANGTYYANEVSFTTANIVSPIATAPSLTTSTTFTATWNVVPEATAYEIDVYESNLSSNTTTETFTSIGGGTTSNYSTRSWTGNDNITWTAYNSRTDQVIFSGNDALTLKDASGSYLQSGEITGNPTNITFDIKQSFSGSGGEITLSILHGVSFGTTTQIGVYSYNSSTQNIVAPISGISGPFKVVLSNNTAARPTIDNLAITKTTGSLSYILQNHNVGNVTFYQVTTGLNPNTTYYYVVRALDATSESINSNEIELTTSDLLSITSSLTTTATVGNAFNYTITTNGTPTSFAASGLPAGLSINSFTGVISGTPTQAGIFNVAITASNASGTDTETLEITVVPTTTLHSRSCGATISATTSFIYADQVPHADAYEFEVTYNGDVYPIVTSNGHRFRLSEVSGLPLVFNATYSVRVRVVIDGVVSDFGTSCDVTTPSIPVTTLGVQSCGATISATTSFIYAASVVGADDYEFEVTHNEITYPTVVSNDYRFRLSEVEGLPLLFGATYSIKVRIHSNGFEGAFGSSCNVMTPSIPTTTLGVQSCGATLSATTSFIYAASVVGASAYEFEVTHNNITYPTVVSNDYRFRLSEVEGLPLMFGATYSIKVRIHSNGFEGDFGSPCNVITPSIPTTTLGVQSCGATLSATTSFIYAASVVGASAYEFEVTHNNITYPTVVSNDYRFRLSEVEGLPLLFGATYSIKVRIHSNGFGGAFSSSCNVMTPSIPTITLGAQSCGTILSVNTSFIYAASGVGASAYEFEVTHNNITYPSLISNDYRFRLSEVTGLPLVASGDYNIRVRVHSNNQVGSYGQSCLVTVKDETSTTRYVTTKEALNESVRVISVYPNPFTTTFSITPIQGETATLFYQVYDVTGKMIESKSVEANEITNHTIGDEYPAGMYLVIVRQGATTQTFKMVKQ